MPTEAYPLVAVVGPTATGKSELALAIAERFGGEIVNYDSVQVYRGFDIGTAKLPVAERCGIPHHLIDIVEPGETFTAGDYAERARAVLAEIRARGRAPIMAGGTGFYLRATLQGLFAGPRRDDFLRRRLSRRAGQKPDGYLHRLLERLDPASADRIHPNDTPKLIRAIEVCLLGGAPLSSQWRRGRDPLLGYRVILVGLDPSREQLRERIRARTERMFHAGLVEEVRCLLREGVSPRAWPFGALGYRQALDYLEGRLTLEQAIEETILRTRQYAKRQMTWFRRERDVAWFSGCGGDPAIRDRVVQWLGDQGLRARRSDRAGQYGENPTT